MLAVEDGELDGFEKRHPDGVSSATILGFFAERGAALSEATLRKYVQLGLLPRSVRVGRKGKHQGSQGLYPVGVVRQILMIRRLMAEDLTIDQIKRDYFFMRSDLQQLESTLASLFGRLTSVLRERRGEPGARTVTREVDDARTLGRELSTRLHALEARLTTRARLGRIAV